MAIYDTDNNFDTGKSFTSELLNTKESDKKNNTS